MSTCTDLIRIGYVILFWFLIKNVAALSDREKSVIQKELTTVGLQCIQQHPLSLSDIRSFRNKMIPDGKKPKCFVACLFKKIGVMDDMGMISPMKAQENAKKVFKDNEEHIKNVNEIMEKCTSVNQQNTSDGNKGCDRAKLAFNCFTDNADKYGFDFDF
ncbi:general odorant-binding protein 28a-like [Spodoptera litura]|uniref:General odorant-binding protein 28a-like n=1 Tax=Spodoptera litura TaxID=69820 RepID=A0A9J7E9Q0_SPOLT|nr:general odorant-binding protein 28a-like [Spodoptera litura]